MARLLNLAHHSATCFLLILYFSSVLMSWSFRVLVSLEMYLSPPVVMVVSASSNLLFRTSFSFYKGIYMSNPRHSLVQRDNLPLLLATQFPKNSFHAEEC